MRCVVMKGTESLLLVLALDPFMRPGVKPVRPSIFGTHVACDIVQENIVVVLELRKVMQRATCDGINLCYFSLFR